MNTQTTTDGHTVAGSFYGHLAQAWNDGDGAAYGRQFADVTDFVDIRGVRHHGNGAQVGADHQMIFDTVYRESTIAIEVDSVRELDEDMILVHGVSRLDAPFAPPPVRAAGVARSTAILVRTDGTWLCTAFHNTLVTG